MRVRLAIVYKLCSAEDWLAAEERGVFEGSPADFRDDFIHLSAAHQLRETARRHFHGQHNLVLVAFDEASLSPLLRWEASRGGDFFPHVYGPIAAALALRVIPLPWSGITHIFPGGIPL